MEDLKPHSIYNRYDIEKMIRSNIIRVIRSQVVVIVHESYAINMPIIATVNALLTSDFSAPSKIKDYGRIH